MIDRPIVHVAGPPGAGKTTFIEAALAGNTALILAARCVRDDTLRHARETTPPSHPELRRYRQAGAHSAAVFAFAGSGSGSDSDSSVDDFYMTDLMTNYAHAVLIEGVSPLPFVDLRVFVAPAPTGGEELLAPRSGGPTGEPPSDAAALQRLVREPSGVADLLERIGGAPLADYARNHPEVLEHLHAGLLDAARRPAATTPPRREITERYRGVEHAQLVVVNIRPDSDRQAAESLIADVVRLRRDKKLFDEIVGYRGNRRPVTAVAANLADPQDPGRKTALARIRRVLRPPPS